LEIINGMTGNGVLHWRFGDVAARLLGGHTQPDPPTGWPCWSEPTPALPIDDLVTRLRRRNAVPRLRSPAELKERDIPCPFYAARFAIAAAVWPRWFAEASGVDLENPAFADGRHLRRKETNESV
jgi:hypothetical protein